MIKSKMSARLLYTFHYLHFMSLVCHLHAVVVYFFTDPRIVSALNYQCRGLSCGLQ